MKRFATLLAAACFALGAAALSAQPKETGAGPAAKEEESPQERVVGRIFRCIAEGLPQDWKRAWIEIRELERTLYATVRKYEARFRFATSDTDTAGQPLVPCGTEEVVESVADLNGFLPEEQRRWTGATFAFYRDGRFEVKYDYGSPGVVVEPELPPPAPDKPAGKAKPAAKKK